MGFQSAYQLGIAVSRSRVPRVLQLGVLIDEFVLLVPSFYQIELIGPENSVKLGINRRVYLLIEILLHDLRKQINHRLKEILIFEYKLRLTMTQQNTHIRIRNFLAFIFQFT